MFVRLVPIILLALLGAVWAQLWTGRGSIAHVREMRAQLQAQQTANDQALQVNARLQAEVHDLKEGLDMVEEKARSELGMVKSHEIFVQVTP